MAKKASRSKIAEAILAHWPETLFFLVLLLRLPSLFEPFTYGDEGIYLTLGQAIRRGWTLYRDIHDNKPPLLYLLAAVVGSFEYFRLVLFLWSFATIYFFYRLTRLVFPKNKAAIMVSTSAFALLTSSHTFEGNVANAENFMLLPIIAAFYLAILAIKKRPRSQKPTTALGLWFLAGFFLALATLFKVPAVFDFLALLAISFLVLERKKTSFVISYPAAAIFGFSIPIVLSLSYYAAQSALDQYLTAAFLQNIPYLASWVPGQPRVGGLSLGLLCRGLTVLFLISALYVFRKKVSLGVKVVLIWFFLSWFAALLSSRPYPHYLIQLLPAFSLSLGLFFSKGRQAYKEKIVPALLIFILITSFITLDFWRYPNFPYYLNFYQFSLGFKGREKYLSDFDLKTEGVYQIADYLKRHTLPDEKIFIWGNDPFIYALAERPPAGRYVVAYHIFDFNGQQETLNTLTRNPPRYLIVTDTENRPFPELTALVQNNYLLETRIGSTQILHHRP